MENQIFEVGGESWKLELHVRVAGRRRVILTVNKGWSLRMNLTAFSFLSRSMCVRPASMRQPRMSQKEASSLITKNIFVFPVLSRSSHVIWVRPRPAS